MEKLDNLIVKFRRGFIVLETEEPPEPDSAVAIGPS